MRRGSFWAYALRCVLLLAALAALGGFVFRRKIEDNLVVLLEGENLRAARLAGRILRDASDSQDLVKEIDRFADARVTVIALDGKVLADSGRDPASMENHSDRPEFQAAIRDGFGHSIRRSATLGTEMLYSAARVEDAAGAPRLVVRLARTIDRVEEVTHSFSNLVGRVVPLMALLGVLTLYFLIEVRLSRARES